MNYRTFLAGLVLCGITANSAGAASLLVNGDFETTDGSIGSVSSIALNAMTMGQWDVYKTIPGWTSTLGPGIEIQRNTIVTAHSGSRYVELESHPVPGASNMLQKFTPTQTRDHTLSFWYQPRTAIPGDNIIRALLDGVVLTTVSGPPQPPLGLWTQIVVGLGVLTAGTDYTLGFDAFFTSPGHDPVGGLAVGGFIDTVSISAVPLPAALPLFGTALGMLGFFGLRGRRKARSTVQAS